MSDRSFWVVERFDGDKSAGYWGGASSRTFISNIDKAIQFCRRQDAMWVIAGWHWKDVQITEHIILSPTSALSTNVETVPPSENTHRETERLRAALERCIEVIEFAYMNAPEQPKELAEARAALPAPYQGDQG